MLSTILQYRYHINILVITKSSFLTLRSFTNPGFLVMGDDFTHSFFLSLIISCSKTCVLRDFLYPFFCCYRYKVVLNTISVLQVRNNMIFRYCTVMTIIPVNVLTDVNLPFIPHYQCDSSPLTHSLLCLELY